MVLTSGFGGQLQAWAIAYSVLVSGTPVTTISVGDITHLALGFSFCNLIFLGGMLSILRHNSN